MTRLNPLVLAAMCIGNLAGAEEVQLPDIPELNAEDSEMLLRDLVVANVVSQNCDGFAISDMEWELLNGSASILSARFHLDPPQFNELFLHPAYGVLAQDDGCATEGPQIQPLIDRLIEWGGSLGPAE